MVKLDVNFECLGNNVLLEEIKVAETPGGIQLPDSVQSTSLGKCRVVRVGPGKRDDKGQLLPMPVQEGDVVYTVFCGGAGKYAPAPMVLDGRQYFCLSADSLIGKTAR